MAPIPYFNFMGKRVLVTAGGRGIGKAIAKKCCDLKAQVFVMDKDVEALKDLNVECPSIRTMQVDLTDWDATRELVDFVAPIHHLANNAGIGTLMPFLQADLTYTDEVIGVNFKAALNVAQGVAKGMIKYGIKDGTIVNTSSIADTVVLQNLSIYCATKAAMTMLSKSMAVELAPYGIRVNSLRPGIINTDIFKELPPDVREKTVGWALRRMRLLELIEPEDIADAFVFLSSPLSHRITASTLTIDDGLSTLP